MTQKLLLFCLVFFLFLLPSLSFAGPSVKYDLSFKHWGEYYFAWENWHWWKAQGMAESGLSPAAKSSCGATGIMQLMPATARSLKVSPSDPEQNIQGGIHFDRDLSVEYWKNIADTGQRRSFVFASYNAGPGWIVKAQKMSKKAMDWDSVSLSLIRLTGTHASETISYIKHIKNYYLQLK